MAEKANISITFLSNIERGTKWPYPDTLVRIAKALKIEEFELFRKNKFKIDDKATLIDRLVNDIAVSVNNSIENTYCRYRKNKI